MVEEIDIILKEGSMVQFCEVTWDIEAKVKKLTENFNIHPWSFYNLFPPDLHDHYYKGTKVEDAGFIVALASVGSIQYELVQPLWGVSSHRDFLEKHGEGFHHIKLYYKDIEKAKAVFKKKGIFVLEEGFFRDDHWVYFDTEKEHGIFWEIGNCPDVGEPAKVYP